MGWDGNKEVVEITDERKSDVRANFIVGSVGQMRNRAAGRHGIQRQVSQTMSPRNRTIPRYHDKKDTNISIPTTHPDTYHPPPTFTMAYTNGFEQSIPHQQEKNLPGGGNWVVQKFGGTSVGKFAIDIANDIVMYADSLYTPCNPSTDPSPVLA
jgi:hypothetical protein